LEFRSAPLVEGNPGGLPRTSPRTVTVVGGGVAGLSAACALADAGLRVQLVEKRPYLGGRASSFFHPGVREVIDNCQHVIFGCCTNVIGFYRRVGVLERIRWTDSMTMIEPGGRRTTLGSSWLPAPFHGVPRLLAAKAFTAADKIALGRAFRALLRPQLLGSTETFSTWLARHGQTQGAVDRFWRLVIASALNADLDRIAVPYAAKVIRELFMSSARAGSMGMSTVTLGELYAGAGEFLQAHGSQAMTSAKVESARWDANAARWTLATTNGPLVSDYLILALSAEATDKLAPHLPPLPGVAQLRAQAAAHESWPICSLHLWYEGEITNLDHAVLLDREIHWMYNKSRLQPWRKGGSYLELVVSASRRFAALSQAEAIAQATSELGEFFPAARTAPLIKAAFVKEVRATFAVPPGVDAFRPKPQAPWPNCFLAGDWMATGWPSTMESAARSGHLAAEALCTANGAPRTFLAPDLEPQGLMRLLRL